MHRLFVAIDLPIPVRDALLAAQGGVSGARWQTDAQLHLTLRFIGEVDRHTAQDVAAALVHVHVAPFELALAGRGMFDRKGRPDALWVGVTPHEPIKALNARIEQALVRIGLPPEQRAFLPHITLARLGRSAGPVAGFLAAGPIDVAPFIVDDFCLYASSIGHGGSDYRIVERYRALNLLD